MDKFILMESNPELMYMFSLILNESLAYYKKTDTDKLKVYQSYIMTYSVQFIWQMYQSI